jgi:hypothetical protein
VHGACPIPTSAAEKERGFGGDIEGTGSEVDIKLKEKENVFTFRIWRETLSQTLQGETEDTNHHGKMSYAPHTFQTRFGQPPPSTHYSPGTLTLAP